MKAIIADDEVSGQKNLQNLLTKYCDDVEIVGISEDVAETTRLLIEVGATIDVAFLDINLSDGLVFQVLNEVQKHFDDIPFEVVFVTAYSQFAVKACQYGSIGYILKPIDPEELKASVARVRAGRVGKMGNRFDVFQQHYSNKTNVFGKISISALDGIYFLNIKDVARLEADDNYTHIFTTTGERMTVAKTIKFYEELLATMNFYRVHKKHLINLNYMNRFLKGDSIVCMEDGTKIEVSRRRRAAFMEFLKGLQNNM